MAGALRTVEKSDSRGSDLDKLAALAYPALILCAFIWAKEFLLPVVLVYTGMEEAVQSIVVASNTASRTESDPSAK
jgi:hypothetical protein